jgi:hypothetical protein
VPRDARPCICLSLRSWSKPSRMACGVIDCSHRRRTGLRTTAFLVATPPASSSPLPNAYCSIRRKISSPSRPASQAFTMSVTSLRLASLTTAFRRVLVLSTGLRSKYGGMTGRWAKLHLPRLTSNCSGAWISTRWPTALVTTYFSFSKYSSCFSNLPTDGVSARTMSCATDGFSAMTSVLHMSLQSRLSHARGRARVRVHNNLSEFFECQQKQGRTRVRKVQASTGVKAPATRGVKIQTRKSGVHGKGVFAVQDIPEGETIIEYVGEIITWKEAQRRHPWNPEDPNHTFYFHVDDGRVIDALSAATPRAGSTTRATPTARPTRKTAGCSSRALRNIKAGEELNYDYGLIIDEPYTKKLKAEYPCWCGSQELPRHAAGAQATPLRFSMRWPAEAVWEAVAPMLPGFTVEVLPEIDSTNSELMRRARAGQLDPVLLVAERQTAGRGRLGRPGTASRERFAHLLARPAAGAGGLVRAVAGGRRGAGRGLHPAIRLKWPNDLWLRTASWRHPDRDRQRRPRPCAVGTPSSAWA